MGSIQALRRFTVEINDDDGQGLGVVHVRKMTRAEAKVWLSLVQSVTDEATAAEQEAITAQAVETLPAIVVGADGFDESLAEVVETLADLPGIAMSLCVSSFMRSQAGLKRAAPPNGADEAATVPLASGSES